MLKRMSNPYRGPKVAKNGLKVSGTLSKGNFTTCFKSYGLIYTAINLDQHSDLQWPQNSPMVNLSLCFHRYQIRPSGSNLI